MPSRTYLPTLVFLGRRVQSYCARHDATIRKNMQPSVEVLYDALLVALDGLLAAVEIETGD
jgi:hypothetical protein